MSGRDLGEIKIIAGWSRYKSEMSTGVSGGENKTKNLKIKPKIIVPKSGANIWINRGILVQNELKTNYWATKIAVELSNRAAKIFSARAVLLAAPLAYARAPAPHPLTP